MSTSEFFSDIYEALEDDTLGDDIDDTNDEITNQIADMANQINELEATPRQINIVAPNVAPPAAINNNVLDADVRERYMAPIISDDSGIMSKTRATTSTLSGVLVNVNIDERNINIFNTNRRVVIIESNFGRKVDPSYQEYLDKVPVKSTRGRKPKAKVVKKERKKQGNGTCFNSQVTFVVMTDIPKKDSPCGFKLLKFKVFRNDKIQLPGAIPQHLDTVIEATTHVIDVLNAALHPDGTNLIELKTLSVDMKNYKFYLKIPRGHIMSLRRLKKILVTEKIKENADYLAETVTEKRGDREITYTRLECKCKERSCQDCFNQALLSDDNEWIDNTIEMLPHPPINDVVYTEEDVKLSMKFATPQPGKPDKDIRVNIFYGCSIKKEYAPDVPPDTYGAKILILGALDETIVKQVYEYLADIFERYYDELVIDTTSDEFEYILEEIDDEPNIREHDDDQAINLMKFADMFEYGQICI